jgi:Plasmid pRiA4b ORF-3-like protein
MALRRPGARLSYRHDLGGCWDHTVLVEVGDRAGPPTRPSCLDGRGDAPTEDWLEEEPPPARPLDLTALDERLARLWAES